eukprot:Gb_35222 [translate_table: standard]
MQAINSIRYSLSSTIDRKSLHSTTQITISSPIQPSDRWKSSANCGDLMSEPGTTSGNRDWIVMRVGGHVFETTRQTLCLDENSMLAAWVLRHISEQNSVMIIDRDGQRFKHVLNYLRNGTIWLQDVSSLRAVQEEAEYFCLDGLVALCKEKIQCIEAEEELFWKKIHSLQEQLKNLCVGNGHKFACGKGEVLSFLRARRLGMGCEDAEPPLFQLDADF